MGSICSKTINHSQRIFQPSQEATAPSQRQSMTAVLLMRVALGQQEEAQALLIDHADLLLEAGMVTDYSGRTFQGITAYEYAYWAKDTRMCRMLESHMNVTTTMEMLKRCEAIERRGLRYEQNQIIKHSRHFDFNLLFNAYGYFLSILVSVGAVRHQDNPCTVEGSHNMLQRAWMQVGQMQRQLPAHVIHEFFRQDRGFKPIQSFDINQDSVLPRTTRYYQQCLLDCERDIFVWNADYQLGLDFALFKGEFKGRFVACGTNDGLAVQSEIRADFKALLMLDYVRTADLEHTLANLRLMTLAVEETDIEQDVALPPLSLRTA